MLNMLNYLNKINNPLYKFLTNHSRVKELTAIQPYHKTIANVLGNTLPFTFRAKQAMNFSLRMKEDIIKKIQFMYYYL